ncbi:MAG: hypothetical protein FJ125_10325 [Deltaproteobacteria bacterium]|nr:hypothetical protein [Deltaproteobacteria bacterium]
MTRGSPDPGADGRLLSRREFLAVAAGSLAALTVIPACEPEEPIAPRDEHQPDCAGDAAGGEDVKVPELDIPASASISPAELVDGYFAGVERERVLQLGRRWVQSFGEDTAALQGELSALLELTAGSPALADALARLDVALLADFDGLRLQQLEGWCLAPTELRLCGLTVAVAG